MWYLPEQFTIRISLVGSKPEIWRRVEVHSGLTLQEFHLVLQAVFGWSNSHLHHFIVTPDGTLGRDAMSQASYYQPKSLREINFDGGTVYKPSENILLGQAFPSPGNCFLYEYDFGDSWMHRVELESRVRGGEQTHIPECLGGQNAAPLEDSGGIPGHVIMMDALAEPSDPNRAWAMDVYGKDFDRHKFELAPINKRLKATFRPLPVKKRANKSTKKSTRTKRPPDSKS